MSENADGERGQKHEERGKARHVSQLIATRTNAKIRVALMSAGTYHQVLAQRGFRAFLWTQFLGAFNDNVCRLVISMVALAAAGATGSASGHLPWVTAVFALPFLLFSGYAGQLADSHSKRTVLVATTVLEVVAMGVGVIAFAGGRLEWLLVVLFLIATQSAFFSPAKYGIVPEIVPEPALSRANGLLEMSTFAAIVLGSAAGTALYALWDERLATIGIALTAIAAVGAAVSIGIPHVGPARRAEPLRWNPWAGLSAGLTRLTSLLLDTVDLTDAGIAHVAGFKRLKQLDLYHTLVTDKGFQQLKQALPDCVIHYSRDSARRRG